MSDALAEVFLIVHVLAACVWVGGTVALVVAGVPAIRVLEGEPRAQALYALGERWRPLGWSALGLLVASGLTLAQRAHAWDEPILWAKVALFTGIVVITYLNNFRLGPALARQIRAGATETMRPRMVVLGWTNFALTLTVPVLGVLLAEMT